MSLQSSTLKKDLKDCFDAMEKDSSGDNSTFAKKVSKTIADYVKTGTVVTADAGTVSAGVFVGKGTGAVSVDASIAEKIIYAACITMETMTVGDGNDYLAQQIADGVQAMMTAGIVSTDVTGVVTPPTGSAITLSGTAKGQIQCVQAPLYSNLKAVFEDMENMTDGGNEYMAAQMAAAIDSYLKAGTVSTMGTAALSGSTGHGTLS